MVAVVTQGSTDERLARLESNVEHLQKDVTELRKDVRALDAKMQTMEAQIQVLRLEIVKRSLTDRVWMLLMNGATLGIMAHGFKWI